jgi:hypothetical protein
MKDFKRVYGFLMEIWRILNGFRIFNVNLGVFNYFINIYRYFMEKEVILMVFKKCMFLHGFKLKYGGF